MSNRGQTLIEVVVASTVGILVVAALTFATIFSLRNANFAKNSALATKLAQEGIEKVRSIRDQGQVDSISNFSISSNVVNSWKNQYLWSNQITTVCPTNNCYFNIVNSSLQFLNESDDIPSNAEDPLGDGKFQRVVILSDDDSFEVQKTATVIVRWKDAAGAHDSKLTTILRKL